jgi:hypothetical protein
VEEGPIEEGLDGVVGTVQRAPAHGVGEVASVVEVLGGEAVAGLGVDAEELLL